VTAPWTAAHLWAARLAGKVVGYSGTKRPTLPSLYRGYVAPRSRLEVPFGRWLLRVPLVLGLAMHGRRLWFRLTGHAVRELVPDDAPGGSHLREQSIPHNRAKMSSIQRDQTERLMNVLGSVHAIDRPSAEVLCIGPRNEFELLLLASYGFSFRNVSAIDLFSYSPKIRLMDVQRMSFPDASFDVAYASLVLRYCPDAARACGEIARVVRPGGHVAVAFATSAADYSIVGTRFAGGLDELYGYFNGRIAEVLWRESYVRKRGEVWHSTVFRLTGEPDAIPAGRSQKDRTL